MGERLWGRPLVLLAAVVMLGMAAGMVAHSYEASRFTSGGFRDWVAVAAGGFGVDVQIGLVVVTVLLVADGMIAGDRFGGQWVPFAAVGTLAGLGVAANCVAAVDSLTLSLPGGGVFGSSAAWRTITIAGSLVPVVVAALAGWGAWTGWCTVKGGEQGER